MTTGVVTFDPAAFSERYPEFSTASTPLLTRFFDEATLYCANTPAAIVSDTTERELLLNMLTAHIGAIYFGANGNDPSELVGRISDASEGSVSVRSEMNEVPGKAAWYMQTKYGASYWAATAKYRQMRYVSGYSTNGVPAWQQRVRW